MWRANSALQIWLILLMAISANPLSLCTRSETLTLIRAFSSGTCMLSSTFCLSPIYILHETVRQVLYHLRQCQLQQKRLSRVFSDRFPLGHCEMFPPLRHNHVWLFLIVHMDYVSH